MLKVSHLNKNFGDVPVLHDISFSVSKGQLAAILGASGSGKTTILRLIAGFLKPDAGCITLHETVIASAMRYLPPEKRGIGYVAQEGALFPHLSVAQNIGFGLTRAQRREGTRIEPLLAMVGLPSHYGQRPPQALSGGEQQRVALARALAPQPRLLLLDEPFSALDAGLRAETRRAVNEALEQAGATAILVTHDQDEALSMGQTIGVMQQGRLVQWADPETLYRHPISPDVASFVGEALFVAGDAAGTQAVCALGMVALSTPNAQGAVKLMIRPEQIEIVKTSDSVPAYVTGVTYYGHDAAVALQLSQGNVPKLMARVPGHAIPQTGSMVGLSVKGPVMAYPLE